MKTENCSICQNPLEGHGNNAEPVNKGNCCNECNLTVVIPARLNLHKQQAPKKDLEKSELKSSINGFNNMPSRQELRGLIKNLELDIKFVDINTRDYWKNEEDTLVFELKSEGTVFAEFMWKTKPDEFDTIKVGQRKIHRLWWD